MRQTGNTVSNFLSVHRVLQHFLIVDSAFAMYFFFLTELAMAEICREIYGCSHAQMVLHMTIG
jgi:hypothetical protein